MNSETPQYDEDKKRSAYFFFNISSAVMFSIEYKDVFD
jgi:hypothetical protein